MTGYSRETLNRAKQLRGEPTDAESRLWSKLRAGRLAGAKFRRQQPIGRFVVDFVCQDRRLIVEADGGQHADNEADKRRTAYLESKGYRLLRFWNNDILADTDAVLLAILEALKSPLPGPLPQGEREIEDSRASWPLPFARRRC